MWKVSVVLVLVTAVCWSAHGLNFRELVRARRDNCRALFEPCRGMPRCCGDMQCFWEKGYSVFKEGYCVECVDRSQLCQRDSQCCEPLMCDKGNALHVDGVCDIKKSSGADCYRDEQCASGDCDKPFYKTHGTCK